MRMHSSPVRRSAPVALISKLPFGRRLALRIWNRTLMHLAPRGDAKTYFGHVLSCDVRDMIQATIIHFGVWEPRNSSLFEQIIRPGDTVVDVGANIGYYSLLFAKLTGPSGQVIAVEALPKLAAIVRAHAERNEANNIRVANFAASAAPGIVTLYEAPRTNIGMTTTRNDRGFRPTVQIEALPLTEILTSDELATTTVIKIDIEGAEIPVVRHVLDNLSRFPSLSSIAVEASIRENPEWAELFQRIISLGFQAFDLHNDYDWAGLMNFRPKPPSCLTEAPHDQTDILFTRLDLEQLD